MKRIGLALAVALLVAGCKSRSEPPPPPSAPQGIATSPEGIDATVAQAQAAPAPVEVKFTVAPPAVGDSREVTDTNKMTGTLKTASGEMPIVQHREEKRTEEVLAVEGPVITKLKVSYATIVNHEQAGDQEKKEKDPLEGKTFTLSWEKDAIVIRDDKGKAVKGDLARQIEGSLSDSIGKELPMNKVLASRTFKSGEKVVLSPEEMKALSRQGEGVEGKEITLTLIESKDDVATLQLEGSLAATQPSMTTEIAMKGTVKLQVSTGRVQEMNLAGDIKGAGGGNQLTGTLASTKVFSYKAGAK
jgi:hypothetical protein